MGRQGEEPCVGFLYWCTTLFYILLLTSSVGNKYNYLQTFVGFIVSYHLSKFINTV